MKIYNVIIEYAAFPLFFADKEVYDGLELSPFVSFEFPSSEDNVDIVLEEIFEFLNKIYGDWDDYPFYSLSVDDKACVNQQWYQCESLGWGKLA